MTISALIAVSQAAYGEAVALRAADRSPLTYAGLGTLLAELGAQLRATGIRRGDRVAIVLPNGPEMAVTFLAVASVAAAAPLNPAYRETEFDFFLADLDAKALIVAEQGDSPAVAIAQARGLPIIRVVASPGEAAGVIRFVCEDAKFKKEAASDPPESSDVALLLHTSGTTARPKLVPLSQENLCTSAQNISKWLGLSPADTCLNVMPLFHIHGLVAALLSSLMAGASVVCSEGFDAPKFLAWLRQYRPTWYTAVPTMHAAILSRAEMEADPREIAPLRLIRSSSAALPPSVAAGLEKVFGVPVIEAYGMTEAAHQMCCNPLPPAVRKPGSVGLPAGPDVAIMNAAGDLLPCGQSGEIVIRGRNVTAGYAANDQANAEAFTNGWFRTGDLGQTDADGYLFISGRSKEIINRGGEKISPREIDEALLDHPSIAAAVAFAMPDSKLGEEVAAAVVPRPGMAITERDVMAYAASKLADFKVPRRVLILSDIPKGPTGKVQRVGLAKKLGVTGIIAIAARPFAPPATATEKKLSAIWNEVLAKSGFGIHDSFFDLGGDSILATQVIARVSAAGLGELPIYAFFNDPSVAAMAQTLDESKAIATDNTSIEELLTEIENLSDEEAEALLAKESARERGEPAE